MEYTTVILVVAVRWPHAHKNCDVMTTKLGSRRLVVCTTIGNIKTGAHYNGDSDKEIWRGINKGGYVIDPQEKPCL